MEIWAAGNGEVFIYTESYEVFKIIKSIVGRGTVYERNGKAFAWQFRVLRSKLKFIEQQISEKNTIENKELTKVIKRKNAFRAIKFLGYDRIHSQESNLTLPQTEMLKNVEVQ